MERWRMGNGGWGMGKGGWRQNGRDERKGEKEKKEETAFLSLSLSLSLSLPLSPSLSLFERRSRYGNLSIAFEGMKAERSRR
jgi:hypothetical protein